jgi:hypothetical protein
MKKMLAASALAMVLSFGAGSVANECVQNFIPIRTVYAMESSEQITADGYGALPANMPLARAKMMARRAAIMDAQRNLVEIIKGATVDADSTMNNFLLQSDIVKTKVNGVITGARVVSEGLEDGGYHVVLSVPEYGVGSVAEVAIDTKMGNYTPEPVPAPSATAIKTYKPEPQAQINGGYTGLVIDAKGSALVRTFCPVIYDTNGRAIYGVHNVDKDYAISHGIVDYADGSASWQTVGIGQSRAGSNPLIIKMVSLRDRATNKCDIVISVEDADKILIENQKHGFLNRYSVVFEK